MSSVTIKSKDFEIELPVVEGSEKEKAIDISSLRSSTGYITLDPGYGNTGSCNSSITFINGEKGILRYRGYPIEQLANESSFLEVAYLLIKGELPDLENMNLFREIWNSAVRCGTPQRAPETKRKLTAVRFELTPFRTSA